MCFQRLLETGTILVVSAILCFGHNPTGIAISPHGLGVMDIGLIVDGYDKNAGDISDVLFNKVFLRIGLDVALSKLTTFTGSMEVKTFNEFPRLVKLGGTRRFYYYLYAHQVELTRILIDNSKLRWDIGGGYFPYKYNRNARNLGEYLFRSTAYPQTISTEFDFAYARLLGFYSKKTLLIGEHHYNLDVLLNFNTEWVAIGDVNLSLIAAYNFARLFEIGAGVEFGSIISADEETTTPKNDATRYFDGTDTTTYYTFRGTKIMGRFSFDPKKLFDAPIFGEEDLELYGEAALLGVKNYDVALYSPIWYNSILERIPVMVGFNVPTFKLLDVLSIEGQWWGNRYPNSMQGIVEEGLPLPFLPGTSEIDSVKYKKDNFKWSVYGSRIFSEHYKVAFQVASDHMRTFAWDWNRQDWEESLRGPDKWYWVVRFGVMF